MDREGRVVAITGASSGVGRACARAFGARGGRVGLIARGIDGLKEAAREVEDAGGRALVVPADVSDPAKVEEAADAIESELGPIDVWINDAMVSVFSPISDMTPDEVRRVTAVNYLGTVNGTLSALRRMRPRDRGTIVQVGSGLAYRAIPLQSAYCASKHAVRAFTESLRTELMHGRSAVRITIVQLPGLNTPHFTLARSRMPRSVRPVAPIYTPELAARAVTRAADHPRREYVVGGMNVLMIAAQKVAPGLLDRYLARFGFVAQMTDQPSDPRDGNLYESLPGDPGATGPFTSEAHDRSLQRSVSAHRRAIAAAGLAAVTILSRRVRR